MTGPRAADNDVVAVDVAAVGMVTTDVLWRLPGRPDFGASMRASAYVRACGGPAATAAACVTRLGGTARFVGRTGSDGEGDFVAAELARQGVDISRLRRAEGTSRVATVLVDEGSGERGFLSWPESFEPLAGADVQPADVADAAVVLIDDADDAGLRAAQLAREAGATTLFDGTWQSDRLADFLPCIDHAVVGEFFARRWMPGAGDDDILRRLRDLGAGTAVLTLGARGCVARDADGALAIPACPAEVVDTTGAGDAFHGGYAVALVEPSNLEERLRFAAVVASLNCRDLGGQAGLPTRAEVAARRRTWR